MARSANHGRGDQNVTDQTVTDQIRVRLYDVLFGDAILITVPDLDGSGETVQRHVLIDIGNVLAGRGGADDVYEKILRNVAEVTGDHGVDLYVMTHEHMDHVQGLLHGATKVDPPIKLNIDTVWLTGSADPEYYETFTDAKKHLDATNAVYTAITRHVNKALKEGTDPDPLLMNLLDNNNPRKTSDCVSFLRDHLTTPDHVHYVHREFDPIGHQPFHEAVFEMWAPEQDTSAYYGRFKPMALGSNSAISLAGQAQVTPPSGVDATAFYTLVEHRRKGIESNAMAIDKAKNNSSVVFAIVWRGRRLLFSGDAETRSWKTMARERVLRPVDFLKVSHHGSHNGTPKQEILDEILPVGIDGRIAAVSTCGDTYNNVPDEHTTHRLEERVTVVSTKDVGGWVDVFVPSSGPLTHKSHS